MKDGIYQGHSELGMVIVDVKVTVECSKIIDIEIVEHQNGFGQWADHTVRCRYK